MSRVACQPSISPNATSIRMTSGASETDMATPVGPSSALQTVKPRRCSRRVSMSRFAKLSSTSRIFLAGGAGALSLGSSLNLFSFFCPACDAQRRARSRRQIGSRSMTPCSRELGEPWSVFGIGPIVLTTRLRTRSRTRPRRPRSRPIPVRARLSLRGRAAPPPLRRRRRGRSTTARERHPPLRDGQRSHDQGAAGAGDGSPRSACLSRPRPPGRRRAGVRSAPKTAPAVRPAPGRCARPAAARAAACRARSASS